MYVQYFLKVLIKKPRLQIYEQKYYYQHVKISLDLELIHLANPRGSRGFSSKGLNDRNYIMVGSYYL